MAKGMSHPHRSAKTSQASRAESIVQERSIDMRSSTHCQKSTKNNTEQQRAHQSGYLEKIRGADLPPKSWATANPTTVRSESASHVVTPNNSACSGVAAAWRDAPPKSDVKPTSLSIGNCSATRRPPATRVSTVAGRWTAIKPTDEFCSPMKQSSILRHDGATLPPWHSHIGRRGRSRQSLYFKLLLGMLP